MDDLYKWIDDRCRERGIKVSKMCADIGIRQSVISELKHGRTKTLSPSTAYKLAAYFGVDILDLLDFANKESADEYFEGWKDARATYAVSDDLAQYLEMLRTRPECRMLFSVAKDATKDDVESAVAIIEALRKKEGRN